MFSSWWTMTMPASWASLVLFDRLRIHIDPTETMSNLTVGKQQMCEIAKAISYNSEVIVLDDSDTYRKGTSSLWIFQRRIRESMMHLLSTWLRRIMQLPIPHCLASSLIYIVTQNIACIVFCSDTSININAVQSIAQNT